MGLREVAERPARRELSSPGIAVAWWRRGALTMNPHRLSLLITLTISCQGAQAANRKDASLGQVILSPAEVRAAKIEVVTVGEQSVDATLVTNGTVALDDLRSGHVFSPVTGRVTKIVAKLGQRVKRGDPLATIESPDIGSAVSDMHKAEADFIAGQNDLRRKRDLYARRAASAADVEQSEDAERNAKAELERARMKQSLLRWGYVDAVSQTYTLRSPIDGEVLLRNVTPGMEVQGQYSGGPGNVCVPGLQSTAACGELFTVGELDRVWVLGDVYEVDLPRLHVGARAAITTVAHPNQVFTGIVDWISSGLDPGTRTAKVRCTLDNPEGKLRPMMYTQVAITVDERRALAIPRSAVVPVGETKVVFLEIAESDGKLRFQRLPVDLEEARNTDFVAVRHGVTAGQKIVSMGATMLSERL
jgi:cobalt-zinc-cadmium efflux system membrane fusion protein